MPDPPPAPTFPVVFWGTDRIRFLPPGSELPPASVLHAALVFAMQGEAFVVADIPGRGWCIPGGRLEPGETPEMAAHRETREEIGATLGPLRFLGDFTLTNDPEDRTALVPTYVAGVLELGPLPADTESRGVRSLRFEDLPANYHRWDPLLEAVFAYALAVWSTMETASGSGADGGSGCSSA